MNLDELHKYIDKIIDEVHEKVSNLQEEMKEETNSQEKPKLKEGQKEIHGFVFDEKKYCESIQKFPFWVADYDTLEKYCLKQKADKYKCMVVLKFIQTEGRLIGLTEKINDLTNTLDEAFDSYMSKCKSGCVCDDCFCNDEDDDE